MSDRLLCCRLATAWSLELGLPGVKIEQGCGPSKPLIKGTNLAVVEKPTPGQQRKGIEVQNQKALQKELQWLKDPFKLTEHIRFTLRNNDPEKAMDLCRLASKSMDCVVGWNAIVDFYMQRKKVSEAIKVYNEMKKRAQFPDSYTYVLLLRGLAVRGHVSQEVRKENAMTN